jgi:hypothetical protein
MRSAVQPAAHPVLGRIDAGYQAVQPCRLHVPLALQVNGPWVDAYSFAEARVTPMTKI